MRDAEYEVAVNTLAMFVGGLVLVMVVSGETVIASSGGELVDAVPHPAGSEAETLTFRVLGGSTFLFDRETFRGLRIHPGEERIEGVNLRVAGEAELRELRGQRRFLGWRRRRLLGWWWRRGLVSGADRQPH